MAARSVLVPMRCSQLAHQLHVGVGGAAKVGLQVLQVDHNLVQLGVVERLSRLQSSAESVVEAGAGQCFGEAAAEQFGGAVEVYLVLNFCLFHG